MSRRGFPARAHGVFATMLRAEALRYRAVEVARITPRHTCHLASGTAGRFGGVLLTVIDLRELSGRGARCRGPRCLPARPAG